MTTTRIGPSPARWSAPGSTPGPGAGRAVHRRDIEGLRAVAVLLVVLYHCGVSLFGGGYVGVDVFFVISGFLITSLLLREMQATGRISIVGFYARRFLRLLPAAVLVTVVTVVAAIRWLPPLRSPQIALDGLFATLYAMNYRLAAVGADYLNADAAPSPLQHFWSLAVEEQFYAVWPMLLLAAFALGRGRGLVPALAAVAVLSFAVSVWQTDADSTWAYFGLHTRAWELGAGALVAVAGVHLPRRVATLMVGAGLAAIVLSAVVYTARTPFPGYAALLPVLGAAAVLAGGATAPSGLLGETSLQVIGKLSYSWYLWHWPFLMIGPYALGISPGVVPNLLLAAGALAAAGVTYVLVENPVRHLAALRRRPWRSTAAGLAVTAAAAGVFLLIAHGTAPVTDPDGYRAPTPGPPDVPRLQRLIAASAHVPAVPANLEPALHRAPNDRPRYYQDDCDTPATESSVRTPCTYGDPNSPVTAVLFGDSHAGHWFPALERVALDRHWKLVVVTKSACSAADSRIYYDRLKREYTECAAWREAAWARIRALRPAMVFMASVGRGDLLDPGTDQDRTWARGWATSVDRVAAGGAKVYVIADTPWQSLNVPDCLSEHPDDPQACASPAASAVPIPRRRAMIAQAVRARNATVIDPLPWFCARGTCPVIAGNVLLYRDSHHMTTAYSRMLAPMLSAAIPGAQSIPQGR